jgi:hypothetical protein
MDASRAAIMSFKSFPLQASVTTSIADFRSDDSTDVRIALRAPMTVEKQSGNRQQASEDEEPVAILELGAATSWNIRGGAATFAPNFAAEITPVELYLNMRQPVECFH